MGNQLLIEHDMHESRVALLEEGRLAEVRVERRKDRRLLGSIYKGRVTRVLPGIEAVFVDIGLDRDAFLFAGDLQGSMDTSREVELEDEEIVIGEGAGPQPITELIAEGQEILVQVVKEPLPNKGARITQVVTLPGRYIVLLPYGADLGISRRIEDSQERERLQGLMEEIRPASGGLIVRTVGQDRSEEELRQDLDTLLELWQDIERRAIKASVPVVLHEDVDLPMRAVRDVFSRDFDALWVTDAVTYDRIRQYLGAADPDLVARARLHTDAQPLFDSFGVEEELDRALQTRAWLPSGGYLVFNSTEALVAIDVNTGRYVGDVDLETTALKVNLEAAREIGRQLRLRDLGGIIVIDFIDMVEQQHREEVLETFAVCLEKDRARVRLSGFSDFGLVQVTRKRSRPDLTSRLTRPCPDCQGRGRVKSESTVCLQIRKEVLRRIAELGGRPLLVRTHPLVAAALSKDQSVVLQELEERLGTRVRSEGHGDLQFEEFEIIAD